MNPPRLIFIHGWGFDAEFWRPLASQLADFPQTRIERGFFGAPPRAVDDTGHAILIGHSLGFIYGLRAAQNWRGLVAINAFPRFVSTQQYAGCVGAAVLRDMRVRLQADPGKTLRDFHHHIGTLAPSGSFNVSELRAGLDELRDGDVEESVAAMNSPALVLAARHDPLVPLAVSAELARAAHARFRIHESGGHALPVSDPAWCGDAIADFARSLA